MRDGDARMTGRGKGRRHARHDFVGNSRRREDLDLLAAAAEKIGIAALEAHDHLALPGCGDHAAVDFLLEHLPAAVRMPEADPFRRWRRMLEQRGIDQIVVEHQVGLGQALRAADGDQAGIAGPGPDQADFSAAIARCCVMW